MITVKSSNKVAAPGGQSPLLNNGQKLGARTTQGIQVDNNRAITGGTISRVSNVSGIEVISLQMGAVAATTYIIGDGAGIYAGVSGGTFTAPTSLEAASWTLIKERLKNRKMKVIGLNMRVSVSDSQFSNRLNVFSADINGEQHVLPVKYSQYQLPSDQNKLCRVVDLNAKPIILGVDCGFYLTVNAGETLIMDMIIGEYND